MTWWVFALSNAWSAGTDFVWTPCRFRHLLGYRAPTMDQALRADRAGWVRLAEKVDSLKRRLDGSLPLDAALDELRMDPATIFHLMPLPVGKADKPFERPSKVPPVKKEASPKKTAKGKGKGRMPTEVVGLHQNLKSGKRICYNYKTSARVAPLPTPVPTATKDAMCACVALGNILHTDAPMHRNND